MLMGPQRPYPISPLEVLESIFTMRVCRTRTCLLIFLVFCIGARFGLAYLAKNISNSYLIVYSLIIGIIGVSFLFLSVTGLRKTGAETGGNAIWWGHLRPIHGILYVLAAGLLFYRHRCWGSKVIIVDTLIGLTAFLHHHLREGDIKF